MPYTGQQKRDYQLQWMNKRRQDWIDSQGGVCTLCGSDDRLEVDHIDPSTKSMNPALIWSRRAEVRKAELEKCQVLCYEHHHEKTVREFTVDHPHGVPSRYDKGCRCQPCKDSKAEVMRRSRARRKKT